MSLFPLLAIEHPYFARQVRSQSLYELNDPALSKHILLLIIRFCYELCLAELRCEGTFLSAKAISATGREGP
jgi:hypothetical protein